MKLLVLAQTPPPIHGQSVMVRTVVEGLPAHGIEVHHVNLALSRDSGDIGRWRPGKIAAVVGACVRTLIVGFRNKCETLYYVPAPAKRGALCRDWVVMLMCRPFFKHLVLHWHAAGLGEWLADRATAPERWLTWLLLGRADLAIILGQDLQAEAAVLRPRRMVIVPNGIADPCPGFARSANPSRLGREAVFLGLGLREKGLLDAAEAVIQANRSAAGGLRWLLTAAGDFPDPAVEREFAALVSRTDGALRHAGFVTGTGKHALLARADVLIFPTRYPAETQGLVVLEALAYDLPVIVTRWRAVAENLPPGSTHIVSVGAPEEIADCLARIAREPPATGSARSHFLAHGTREIFLSRLAAALRELANQKAE